MSPKLTLLLLFFIAINCKSIEEIKRNLVVSTSSSDCRNCLANSSNRWCIQDGGTSNQGECCSSGDSSGYCADSSLYVCTGEENRGLNICPTYSADCGTLTYSFGFSGDTDTIARSFITSNVVCVYKLSSTSFLANRVEIKVSSASNLDLDVYTSSTSNEYDHKGSMEDDDTKSVPIDRTSDVYIVAVPTGSANRIDIDLTTTYESNDLDGGAIAGIIIGSICGFVLCFGCIIGIIVICSIKASQNSMNNAGNVRAAAIVHNPPPPPAIYEDPNINQPVYLIPQNEVMMQPQMIYQDPSMIPNANAPYDPNIQGQPQPQMAVPVMPPIGGPALIGNPVAPVQEGKKV